MFYVTALFLWILAHGVVRLLGQFLFDPSNPLFYILILLTVPAVYGFTYSLYYKFHFTYDEKVKHGSTLLPILMLLEIPVFLYWQLLFPNMNWNTMLIYAIYLLGFYALCIFTLRFPDPIKRTVKEHSEQHEEEHHESHS